MAGPLPREDLEGDIREHCPEGHKEEAEGFLSRGLSKMMGDQM